MKKLISLLVNSLLFAALCGVLALVGYRYFSGTPFLLDERCIIINLREREPLELFDNFRNLQAFPRGYLALLDFTHSAIGEKPYLLRLIPTVFGVTGSILWVLLLRHVVGGSLAGAALGAILFLYTVQWPVYAIQLKQYSAEVFVALVLFLIPDRWFREGIECSRRRGRLIAFLLVPLLFSYTYALVLAARVGVFVVTQSRRSHWRKYLASYLVLGLASAASATILYHIDYRHLKWEAGEGYWDPCYLNRRFAEGWDPTVTLIRDLVVGWYPKLPLEAQHVAFWLFWIGVAVIVFESSWSVFVAHRRNDWDSRALAAVGVFAIVFVWSFVKTFPICASRGMLFSAPFSQVIILKGLLGALSFLAIPSRWFRLSAELAVVIGLGLVISVSWRAQYSYSTMETDERSWAWVGLAKPETRWRGQINVIAQIGPSACGL